MMSSCCTLRLNRRSALSSVSLSPSLISANCFSPAFRYGRLNASPDLRLIRLVDPAGDAMWVTAEVERTTTLTFSPANCQARIETRIEYRRSILYPRSSILNLRSSVLDPRQWLNYESFRDWFGRA